MASGCSAEHSPKRHSFVLYNRGIPFWYGLEGEGGGGRVWLAIARRDGRCGTFGFGGPSRAWLRGDPRLARLASGKHDRGVRVHPARAAARRRGLSRPPLSLGVG